MFGSFVSGLHADARARFTEPETLAALAAHRGAFAEAWPGLAVTDDRFAAELARRLGPDATPSALAAACGSDVGLAIACVDGDAAAIERCDQLCQREVGIAAAKLRATPDQSAEIKAHVTRVLLVDEPGRAAALRDYSGRGNLRAYVRVIATRDLVRLINRGRREAPAVNEEILERLATLHDPELSMLKARYHDAVAQAMRVALGELDDRSRALLRYAIVDGWTVDQVGKVYGVHRATAARWIAAARDAFGDAVQEALADRLEIDPDEVASIIRLVQSRVDVSLERLLS